MSLQKISIPYAFSPLDDAPPTFSIRETFKNCILKSYTLKLLYVSRDFTIHFQAHSHFQLFTEFYILVEEVRNLQEIRWEGNGCINKDVLFR